MEGAAGRGTRIRPLAGDGLSKGRESGSISQRRLSKVGTCGKGGEIVGEKKRKNAKQSRNKEGTAVEKGGPSSLFLQRDYPALE